MAGLRSSTDASPRCCRLPRAGKCTFAESFRQAERCFKGGDKAQANMHLALTGLNALEDIDAGRERLLTLRRSSRPDALLKSYGLPTWEELTKDDDSDDSDDEDDEDSEDEDDGGGGNSHYNPDEPRIPAGQPGGGQWTTAGNGIADLSPRIQIAQEIFLEEEPVIIRPPLEQFPTEIVKPPGPEFQWKGQPGSNPGDPEGSWYNPNTGEVLRPDLDHPPPIPPHWDYKAPDGQWYRWFPDGTVQPKPVVIPGQIA